MDAMRRLLAAKVGGMADAASASMVNPPPYQPFSGEPHRHPLHIVLHIQYIVEHTFSGQLPGLEAEADRLRKYLFYPVRQKQLNALQTARQNSSN